MKHDAIVAAYNLSLYVLLPLGVLVMIWWGRRIYMRAHRTAVAQANKAGRVSTHAVGAIVLVYMLPGLLFFILFSIPAMYFSGLLQREAHCIEIIRVNNLTDKNDAFLRENAAMLNIDELFERSKRPQ